MATIGATTAFLIALGVFFGGLALAIAIQRLKLGDSSTFIALLLTPLIVYGIASGLLQEFTGPGGWGAKFRATAQEAVVPAVTLTSLDIQRLEIVAKAPLAALPNPAAEIQKGKPIALTFQFGIHGYSTAAAVQYLKTLSLADPEMNVIVLDQDGRFVAMTEGSTLLMLLQSPEEARIMAALNFGDKNYFARMPAFHSEKIKVGDKNIDALEKMRKQNAKAIVVVDENNKPTGLVKRDDIVARLLENLAAPDKAS
jgi:CBS domain-containing protein